MAGVQSIAMSVSVCLLTLISQTPQVPILSYPLGRGPAYSGPIRWGLYSRPIALTLGGEEFSVNDVCKCMRD